MIIVIYKALLFLVAAVSVCWYKQNSGQFLDKNMIACKSVSIICQNLQTRFCVRSRCSWEDEMLKL